MPEAITHLSWAVCLYLPLAGIAWWSVFSAYWSLIRLPTRLQVKDPALSLLTRLANVSFYPNPN
jgi:hypothetical protein